MRILDGDSFRVVGFMGELRVFGIAWLSWVGILVLCGGSCWSETRRARGVPPKNCYFCHSVNGDMTVICSVVSYAWNHNRSVICPFGCGCNNAPNEICHSGVVFLMEEFGGGSPGQSGQICHSHNIGHQGSCGQNDLSIHRQNTCHHWTSYWLWKVLV